MSPLSFFKRNSMLLPGTEVIVWGRLGSPLVSILLRTKLHSLDPLSWDMDYLLTLWLTLPLVPLVMVAAPLVFWSLSFPKEVSCTTAYIHTLIEKSLKHLCSIRALVPVSFLFVSLSFSGWFSGAWRPVELTFLPGLLRPSWEGTVCHHPERAPGPFVSDASPVSRALSVLCVNQGISASFSLLLSYRQLHTTRFQSIKGPQQNS